MKPKPKVVRPREDKKEETPKEKIEVKKSQASEKKQEAMKPEVSKEAEKTKPKESQKNTAEAKSETDVKKIENTAKKQEAKEVEATMKKAIDKTKTNDISPKTVERKLEVPKIKITQHNDVVAVVAGGLTLNTTSAIPIISISPATDDGGAASFNIVYREQETTVTI